MAIRTLKWLRQGSVFLAALALTLGTGAVQAPAASAQGAPVDGIVCTTGAAATPTFNLSTTTGYVGTPDDNVVFMWGYTVQGSAFQHPSPVLCVKQSRSSSPAKRMFWQTVCHRSHNSAALP